MGTLTKEQATVEKLLPEIRATHVAFLKSGQETVELAREIGERLLKLKECVKHGEFTSLVEKRCELSQRTAQTYMKLAAGWAKIKKTEAAAATIDGCIKLIGSKAQTSRISPKPGGNGAAPSQNSTPQTESKPARSTSAAVLSSGTPDLPAEGTANQAENGAQGKGEQGGPKISGGVTFDVAELTSESKDAFDETPPDELRQVFELRAGFEEQRNRIASIKSWITANENHPGGVVLAAAAQRIRSDLDQASSELKFAAPYCVCVYCKNKPPKVANCTACKGAGWMTEQVYKAAPKGLKREKVKG